jgi:CDP-glucose 4,6-dehydratase
VVERLAAAWGTGATWRAEPPADAPHEATLLTLDSSLAADRLGWRPALDLDRALALTVDWYRRWADDAGSPALQSLMADQLAAVAGVGG